ncbi:type II secretion system protein [Candidatus Dojkabacteria bacterium]|uniref:Type II secretion system protein n=1 Tax=Candidatus Dojkabacteria bacterium TaxID=2099670 RepID=A0A955RGU7_9BACT|nr:type II secretion system protein [Candidatus Dojkabacteria bacterium]
MKKEAFTLIEMLVAMSIMVIILSFGTVGVVRFRDYIELQNGYSDISTYLRTTQNKARNAIAYTTNGGVPVAPDYYGVYVANDNFSLYACNETIPNQVDCTEEESDIKATSFTSVGIELSGCPGDMIAFAKSSVEIIAINGTPNLGQVNSGTVVTNGTCDLLVSHANSSSTRTISINLTQNSIDVQ